MPKSTPTREHKPAASTSVSAPRAASAPEWPMGDLFALWSGQAWMNIWMQGWSAWLQQFGMTDGALRASPGSGDDRRQPAIPWLPQFEATVVPLRRSSDLPGAEAAKVSMRLRVPAFPWAAGTSNVIAIDTLMPRPVGEAGDIPPITTH